MTSPIATLGDGPTVSTRAGLAGISSPAHLQQTYLTEAGREGVFRFSNVDQSAAVTIDADQAVYVAPASDVTGASGAWVRQDTLGRLNIRWFGCVDDSTGLHGQMASRAHRTDNSAKLQRAVNLADYLGLEVTIPASTDPDAFFSTRNYIRFGPRTVLYVEGAVVNGNSAADDRSMVARPGNFHPAFLDRGGLRKIITHACGSPAARAAGDLRHCW